MSLKSLVPLTEENYLEQCFRFRDRQAGVSVIFDPEREVYTYNAYCIDIKLVKELFTVEFDYLEDALKLINDEFGSWEMQGVGSKASGCSSCVAK